MNAERKLATCDGKQGFPSKAQAERVAKQQRKKKKLRLTAYKCNHCRKWHIGDATFVREAEEWQSGGRGSERPTTERQRRGEWLLGPVEKNGPKVARDVFASPIDRLEHTRALSNDQASAGRQFEELYRAQLEVKGTRDSCTIWEPRGSDGDNDGPIEARREYRELCGSVDRAHERILHIVCVEHVAPRGVVQLGQLREALNEAVRFFKK